MAPSAPPIAAPSRPRPLWCPMMPPSAAPPRPPITVPFSAYGPVAQDTRLVEIVTASSGVTRRFLSLFMAVTLFVARKSPVAPTPVVTAVHLRIDPDTHFRDTR